MGIGFLDVPLVTPEGQAIFDEDVAEDGYVMNVSRLWAYNPALVTGLFDLMRSAVAGQELSFPRPGHIGRSLCIDTRRLLLLPRLGLKAGRGLRSRYRRRSDPWGRRRADRSRASVGFVGSKGCGGPERHNPR